MKRIPTTSSKQLDVIVIYAVAGILCGPFLVVVQLIGVALLYLLFIFFTIAVAALITLLLFLGAYRYCRDLAVTIAGVVLFVLLLLSSFGVAISIEKGAQRVLHLICYTQDVIEVCSLMDLYHLDPSDRATAFVAMVNKN